MVRNIIVLLLSFVEVALIHEAAVEEVARGNARHLKFLGFHSSTTRVVGNTQKLSALFPQSKFGKSDKAAYVTATNDCKAFLGLGEDATLLNIETLEELAFLAGKPFFVCKFFKNLNS